MTYATLCLVMMVVAFAAAGLLAARGGRPHWPAILLATGVVLALTAVFDSLMIAAGVVAYGAEHLLGPQIGRAPIEDFSYALVAAVAVPVVFERLAGRRTRGEQS